MTPTNEVLSVIIVSWNTCDLLLKCLESIRIEGHSFPNNSLELIVIDNASSDDSVRMLKGVYPDIQVIENQENIGFARANNQGIRSSKGEYVLLLNPDTEVLPGAFRELVKFMNGNPKAGAAGAQLINPDGSLQSSAFPTLSLFREFWRLFHLDKISRQASYPLEKWNPKIPHRVDVVQGACLILRREAIAQTGLLDEDYFIYTEEADLCFRLMEKGWDIYWVPEAKVIHLGGQSTHQARSEMFLKLYESKITFFRKHHGPVAVLIYKFILALASFPRLMVSPLNKLTKWDRFARHLDTTPLYYRLLKALPRL